METDALNVAHAIDDPVHRSIEPNVIDDVRDVLLSYGSGKDYYGTRNGNTVTHFLTNFVFSSSNSFVWDDVLSRFMGAFIKTDLSTRISIKASFIF